MTEVTVKTLQHRQTGKVHIVELELDSLKHCYCSLNRRREPKEDTIDLSSEEVCETCVKGLLDDEDIENLIETGNAAQLREALQG